MIQDRLKDKDKDVRGMRKATSEILGQCWIKGYQAGFNDGYFTGRDAGPLIGEDIKTGKWIPVEDADYSGGGYWMCSKCSHRFSFGGFNLLNHYGVCPNCGYPMKKEGGDS